MKNFTLTHETPSHFVLHNGKSHFHIAKNGIDVPTTEKIRALAKGGEVKPEPTPSEQIGIKFDPPQSEIGPKDTVIESLPPEQSSIGKRTDNYDEGGQVIDPAKAQSAQDSMRKAFGYDGGGTVTPDPNPVQTFQDSFRKATHYDEGGEVDPQSNTQRALASIQEAFTGHPTPTPTPPPNREEEYAKIRKQNQQNMGYAEGGSIANETQEQAIKRYADGNPATLAKGGAVHHTQGKYHFHFYDGGPVTHSDKFPEAPPTPLDNYENLAEGGEPSVQLDAKDLDPNAALNIPGAALPKTPLQQQMDEASQPEQSPSAQDSANNIARTMGKDLPFPDQDQPASAPAAAVPQAQQISMAPKSASPSSIPDKSDMLTQLNADIKGEQDAILGGKNAEAKGFAAQSQAIQSNLDQQQKSNQVYQNEVDQITKQNTDLFNNVRTDKINPNQFWDSKTTGGKITAGIALLLGGISSGITGKSNPALDVIQKHIQDDIEAQKNNQTQGVNLYKLGLEKYRDTQSAHQYATLQANALLQGQLSKIAAQTGSQTAQFQAQQAIHQLGLQNAELRSNLGLRQAAIQSMNEQPTAKGGVNLDKSRLLTMAGVIPKEEQTNVDKESDDYQKLSQTLDHTDQVFKQAGDTANYTQRIANALPLGSHIPTTRDSTKEYQAVTDAWLGNITKDTEGRVTPTDVDLMRKSLPIAGDPPALIQTKLNNIKDMIRQKYSFNTLKKYKLIPNADQVSTSGATRQKRFTEGPAK